jgi:hypothetical protein
MVALLGTRVRHLGIRQEKIYMKMAMAFRKAR